MSPGEDGIEERWKEAAFTGFLEVTKMGLHLHSVSDKGRKGLPVSLGVSSPVGRED